MPAVAEPLRVIDFGPSSPLRSQTLWHALAYGVSQGAPATLSFTRPAEPYVCLGYHRLSEEVDREYCRRKGLPVLRRMVGGGPVYLDSDQLFFQICLPAPSLPAGRQQALRMLLAPAVSAFVALGVPARLDESGEICVGEQKICGHGAGQIEDAVVLCGNLIEHFDHEQATRVLAFSQAHQRRQTLSLMRRFVGETAVDPAAFRTAMTTSYAAALGLSPQPEAGLRDFERRALVRLDETFTSRAWLAGVARPQLSNRAGPRARTVKVHAGVWTIGATYRGASVVASIVNGRLEQVRLQDQALNGSTELAESALSGAAWDSVGEVLAAFGAPGRRLAVAFSAADPTRL